MTKTESGKYLHKDDAAPHFELPSVSEGRNYSLTDFAGKKGILFIFMCNHCPYVKARVTDIVSLHNQFGSDIAFVGINSSDPEYPEEGAENSKDFARERGILFPYLYDESGSVAKSYGATCTPDPFLFNSEGKLVFHGRITDALEPLDIPHEHSMRDNIAKLLKGEHIEPWFNPSLGCSIKFRAT